MTLDVDKAKKEIDKYFENVTLEQLNKDLIKAGIGFYTAPEEDDYYFIKKSDINRLLGKINRVTSSHRHQGCKVRDKDLTSLSNYQIDFEKIISDIEEKE